MPFFKSEPFATVESMEELFAIAAAMEQEAIDGYLALAERMRRESSPDLAEVFEQLAQEERGHLGHVSRWSTQATGRAPDPSAIRGVPEPTFDDEGAATIAPELLSAYRAFSTAVRNEERAFAFWSYVAAHAPSRELRETAEQMAHEELGHVATLRRERRRAFHAQRAAPAADDWTLPALEERLAALLDAAREDDAALDACARQARERAAALTDAPLGDTPLLRHVTREAAARLHPAAELLLECYLDLGERVTSQAGRDRAQTYAAQMLACLSAVRSDAG